MSAGSAPPVESVQDWIKRAFIGLCGIGSTLLLAFFGWLAININTISANTLTLQSDFAANARTMQSMAGEMAGLKAGLDELRIRSGEWATKDSLTAAKDDLRQDLSKVKEQVTTLEIRMTKIEAR